MPPETQLRAPTQRRSGRFAATEESSMPSSKEDLPADNDSKEASDEVSGANVDTVLEAPDPTPASQIAFARSPIAGSAPRQPIERLASLRGPGRFVESHNSISPESQVKKLKVQPKSSIRRSKEEREATERAEAERLQARLGASSGSSSNVSGKRDFGSRGGARGALSGVSNRWQSERYSGSGASGFLGGATPAEDKRQREASSTRSRGGGRSSMLSGVSRDNTAADAGAKVKREPGAGKSKAKDGDGDVIMGDSGRRKSTRVKTEKKTLLIEESDDELMELETTGRGINIENINLIDDPESSDGAAATGDEGKGKGKSSTPRASSSSFMRPIRLARHEHVQRSIGVNTDPSSVTSAELRRQAKARGDAQGSLFLPEDADPRDDKVTKLKKKARSRDVEFIKNERKWQGVYQDEEDEDKPIKIKTEPKEQDGTMLTDREEPSGTAVSQGMLTQGNTAPSKDDAAHPPFESTATLASGPKTLRKSRVRRPKALAHRRPVLQTDEDHEEWARLKSDVARIRGELLMPESDSHQADTKTNAKRDANAEEIKAKEVTKDKKEGLVYLFQLPPTMPDIEDPRTRRIRRQSQTQKRDSEDRQEPSTTAIAVEQPNSTRNTKPAKPTPSTDPKKATTPSNDPKIKTEPADAESKTPTSENAHSRHAIPPTPFLISPHGTLGHIRLDAEGFPSATWSTDFRLDVGKASDYGALQEVVLMKSEKVELAVKERGRRRVKREEGAKEDGTKCGEEAWAVGQMGGGFVMMPDWGFMFGD
ncbi:MAG: hypothetical protein LQ343_007494 [Gyalolechia ehrenbergii]|nr:MAG: hypothetical protein LQ343_007494 [Gyalolechia ehrenbergii]